MADIVLSSKKKINLFDRVIQSVVILVNMSKMNHAIDEHLAVMRKEEREDQKVYQENILREIVFVKYQYDIMQREMYELKLNYPDEIVENINSTDKIERLKLQKAFLEMEYDRVTNSKFKSKEDIKFSLLAISSAIEEVKQNIKDEGKSTRYNKVIKLCEDIDTKIQTEEYTDDLYKEFFDTVDEYVSYINDNYDISKLPSDERELIEYVIETMINGIESDIDRHMYEYNLVINICKNSYRYFKIIDKIFEKLQKIYDESFEKKIVNLKDYIKMYKEIYDMKIKTMVNDVHRSIATEDEYLEYSKLLANFEYDELDQFIIKRALESTSNDSVKELLEDSIKKEEPEEVNVDEIVEEEISNEDEAIAKDDDVVEKIEELIESKVPEEEKEVKEEKVEVEETKEKKTKKATRTKKVVEDDEKNEVKDEEIVEEKPRKRRKKSE